ncbi:MAG: hypothetical protein CL927_01260 [Deltaproteobacteria bacterium]|nr:hypothetical protein [Deltaproteobacteria bacterium]
MKAFPFAVTALVLSVGSTACSDPASGPKQPAASEASQNPDQRTAKKAQKAKKKAAERGSTAHESSASRTGLSGYNGIYASGRSLTPADVALWSPAEMRIKRNEVYARYGRAFQSADLQKHFGATSWYSVVPTYSDSVLTPTDKANVALISAFEEKPRAWDGPVGDLMFISSRELAIIEGDSMYGDFDNERWYAARGSKYVITWTGAEAFGSSVEELELWTFSAGAWQREPLHSPNG